MTQAPTPGPLTSESVKLLVKGDLLRCINPHTIAVKEGEIRVFECRTHNEPGAGNDIVLSDSYLGTWSGIFAFIGRPDADGWMPWSGNHFGENPVPGQMVLTRTRMAKTPEPVKSEWIDWSSVIAFRLAPTAPVEASGSEREALAVRFHETYERLAPSFGYETRDDTKAFDPTTPNGRLMVAVCGELLSDLRPQPSGETREAAGCAEPQVGRAVYERIEKLLTTAPQGWERDYLCHLVESVEELGGYDGPRVDGRNDRQTVADFLRLRDENVGPGEADDAERLESADAILALLSARPLALEGQQGDHADALEPLRRSISDMKTHIQAVQTAKKEGGPGNTITDCINALPAIVRALEAAEFEVEAAFEEYEDTTPARAEAQDEGAAGERQKLIDDLRHVYSQMTPSGLERMDSDGAAFIIERAIQTLYAHPSPTPVADADRVRETPGADEAFDAIDVADRLIERAYGDEVPPEWTKTFKGVDKARAALKSTAAKEGGE